MRRQEISVTNDHNDFVKMSILNPFVIREVMEHNVDEVEYAKNNNSLR